MNLGLASLEPPSILDLFLDADASIDHLECELNGIEVDETVTELAYCVKEDGFGTSLESLFGDELKDLGLDTTVPKEELSAKIFELSEEKLPVKVSPLIVDPIYGAILLSIVGIIYVIKNHTRNMVALSDKFDIDKIPESEWDMHAEKRVTCVDAKVAIRGLKWSIKTLTALSKLDPKKEITNKELNRVTFGIGVSVDSKGKVRVPRANEYNASLKRHGWNKATIKETITLIRDNRKLFDSLVDEVESISKKIKKNGKPKQIRGKDARIIRGLITASSKMVGIASKSWLRVIKVSPNVREIMKGKNK